MKLVAIFLTTVLQWMIFSLSPWENALAAKERDISFRAEHCQPSVGQRPPPYISKYDRSKDEDEAESEEMDYSSARMELLFQDIYENDNRLTGRVYFHAQKNAFVAPKETWTNGAWHTEELEIPDKFLANITKHMNAAISQKYARFIFFPDMGHGHVHTPVTSGIPTKDILEQHRLAMRDPATLIVYHAAEFLDFQDPEGTSLEDLRFRYLNRNIVGDNDQGNIRTMVHSTEFRPVNTVKIIPGYVELQQFGFVMDAHKDGCFVYEADGKKLFFDLRL